MFDISTSKIKNCVKDLEEQERQIQNLIHRMEEFCNGFTGLSQDKADKRALQAYLMQMKREKQDLTRLRQTLSDIVMCYEKTERKIAGTTASLSSNNQLQMLDYSEVSKMLDGLGISFR